MKVTAHLPTNSTAAETNPVNPPDAQQPTPPAEASTAKVAKWPQWFGPIDIALAIMVIVGAFMATSFVARNADIWRHLATGQRLISGTYTLGSDPLSFTGESRPWVNNEWLYDLWSYGAYSLDETGIILNMSKALMFAAAFGLIFALRRGDSALWPWTVLVGLGVVASAYHASLRPIVFGMLFQSLLMWLLLKPSHGVSRWRTPIFVGIVCLLWTNTDSLAILGPLTVLLLWLGELAQMRVFSQGESPASENETAIASTGTLGRASLLAVLAFLLNPAFLVALGTDAGEAVRQLLPQELDPSLHAILWDDRELASLTLSPLSEDYFNSTRRGQNVVGLCGLMLFLMSSLSLGLGYRQIRVSEIALWMGFGFLATQNYKLIPFFSIVMIPLAARHLNILSNRIVLQHFDSLPTKISLLGSSLGRIGSVVLAVGMIAAAWPGWLHPLPGDPAYNRRFGLELEADPGMVRGAKLIHDWQESANWPETLHGVNFHTDMGDYLAWHAPKFKTFINSRYSFHAAELVPFVLLRHELKPVLNRNRQNRDDQAQTLPNIEKPVLDEYGSEFLVFGQGFTTTDLEQVGRGLNALQKDPQAPLKALWHLDGRIAIIGRSERREMQLISQEIGFNLVEKVFGNPEPLPEAKLSYALKPPDFWLAEYLAQPQIEPLESDDAKVIYILSKQIAVISEQVHQMNIAKFQLITQALAGNAIATQLSLSNRTPSDIELSMPILAARSARLAIAKNPDDAEVYQALLNAYMVPWMPTSEPPRQNAPAVENTIQALMAAQRFLDRNRPPETSSLRDVFRIVPTLLQKFELHLKLQQFDLAREAIVLANTYMKALPLPDQEQLQEYNLMIATDNARRLYNEITRGDPEAKPEGEAPAGLPGSDKPKAPEVLKDLAKLENLMTTDLGQANDQWKRETLNAPVFGKVQRALQLGFPGKALAMLQDVNFETSPKELGAPGYEIGIFWVGVLLNVGQLEQASLVMKDLEGSIEKLIEQSSSDPQSPKYLSGELIASIRLRLIQLNYQLAKFSGNYQLAASYADDMRKRTPPLKLSVAQIRLATTPPQLLAISMGAGAGGFASTLKNNPTDPVMVGEVYRGKLLEESQQSFERGLLALFDGDLDTAKSQFQMTIQPQGVNLFQMTQPSPMALFATRYLQMIQRYDNKK